MRPLRCASYLARRLTAPSPRCLFAALPLRTHPSLSLRTLPYSPRHASSTTSSTTSPGSTSTSSDLTPPLHRTALYETHITHGAKIVPFAGYSMPVLYSDQSVGESHRWTRTHASLFDVGHMVQHRFSGTMAAALFEKVTPTDIAGLKTNHSTLSVLLHEETGGIVDDCVITRLGPSDFYVVTNAGCRDKDIAFLESEIEKLKVDLKGDQSGALDDETQFKWTVLNDQGLVALQGPEAKDVLSRLADFDFGKLFFGQCVSLSFDLDGSTTCLVSRAGYTGEDGFEISIPNGAISKFTDLLLSDERVRLAGLGARDSLRLEAGMCLYGHDLDDSTTPPEAGLSWVISKARRERGGFNGSEAILAQLKSKKDGGVGIPRRRVGLVIEKGPPAREGAEIVDDEGKVLGRVTSGCPSPSLGTNIAMGYVTDGKHKSGTKVGVVVRGKTRSAEVSKMPFLKTRYFKDSAEGVANA